MVHDVARVKSIFLTAVERYSAEQWPAYLDEACGEDTALRERVEKLLGAHGGQKSLDVPAPSQLGATADQLLVERPGTSINPYKLMEQIGEGGMGVVYVAEQQVPVRRKVALKVIKPGMDTRQVIARFEAERQALAMMDHPNIAKIFDGGVSESGRPYFVMELVRGLPITEYCDGEKLSIRRRLDLFVQVCRAVQHAHQKGIIHRDLKPSNILVTLHDGVPVPKVIDFGVAKATGQSLTEKTVYTAFTQLVGTPLYMSPEQAELSGLDIDTRSDIYSLGVLLYELLTGTTPFDSEALRKAAFDEMRRIIREDEPQKPSTRLSSLGETLSITSMKRSSDPRHLNRSVRGELDWIAMKALEKDRRRRYETANDFAADVMRYLTDQPVEACPPSARYRFRKFAKRNRAALTTVGLVALALIGGLMASAWQAARATTAQRLADNRSQMARRAIDELYDQVAVRWTSSHTIRFAPLPRTFLEKSLPFYQGFAEPRRVNSDVGRAHQHVGEILIQLGRREEGVHALHRAETVFKALLAVDPDNPEHLGGLAACYTVLTTQYAFDDSTQAKVITWQTELARRFPGIALYSQQLASSHLSLGIGSWGGDDFPEASRRLGLARAIMERLCAADATNPDFQNLLGHTLRDLANAHRDLDSESVAEPHYRRALKLHEGLVARHPTRPQYQLNLGWDCWELCRLLLRVGRYEEAEPLSARAVTIFEGLSSDYPDVSAYRMYRAYALTDRAGSLIRNGRRKESESFIVRLESLDDRSMASACLSQIAWYAAQQIGPGRPDTAIAVKLARKATEYAPSSSEAWITLGQALFRADDWDAAIASLDRVSSSSVHGAYRLDRGHAYNGFFLAMAYHRKGDQQQARGWYDRSVSWMVERQRRDPVLIRYRDEAAALLGVKPLQNEAKPITDPGPSGPPE